MSVGKSSTQTPQEGAWKHEAYLLFPVHLDGTLLDNANVMKAKKEFFSTSDVLQIFRQLCAGLKHMHSLEPPYAHNDVKPGNVLLTHRKGQPPLAVLMDFGSARPARKQIRSRSEALQLQCFSSLLDRVGCLIEFSLAGMAIRLYELDFLEPGNL
ncbi:Serine/threonine-protein kinase 16 [Vitis vinifera]|uniref:non-specific serine/threonine protein kinase n=1 Tax=Vitis vinifera TaxID=29760 RepID=A0A438JZ07_VITVI|nr:Serine/threonine-protein kinase 16 [Vitis vinifera]